MINLKRGLSRRDFVKLALAGAGGLALGVGGYYSRNSLGHALKSAEDFFSGLERKILIESKYLMNSGRPDIVLVSIDTLRADHFSPEYMPKTYEWAEENCQIFENAYSHSTWTLPSHVTMLSGELPQKHRVEREDSRIPDMLRLVQERIRNLGYYTIAFTDGGFVSREFGFDKGFYEYLPASTMEYAGVMNLFFNLKSQRDDNSLNQEVQFLVLLHFSWCLRMPV
jgi:hypothetical protein